MFNRPLTVTLLATVRLPDKVKFVPRLPPTLRFKIVPMVKVLRLPYNELMLLAVSVPVKARLVPILPPAAKFRIVPTVNVLMYADKWLPYGELMLPAVTVLALRNPVMLAYGPVIFRAVPVIVEPAKVMNPASLLSCDVRPLKKPALGNDTPAAKLTTSFANN